MQYWLLKSEPGTWSWDDQLASPDATTPWDGVRNHLANKHMRAMEVGDRCLFYHSVKAREIVGIVEVVKGHEPDPTDTKREGDKRFGMVTVRAVEPLPRPVSLDEVKAAPGFSDMVLVNNSRLSVQPVTPAEWAGVLALATEA